MKTEVLAYDVIYMPEDLNGHMSINLKKTMELRMQLRDTNELILPSILYKQLFATPKFHTMKSSKGNIELIHDVGLFETSMK
jgi:hypothetical protein